MVLESTRRVAAPSEYLVIIGSGIDDMKISKYAEILPRQSCSTLDISPVNYSTFDVHAMSADKLPFVFPGVVTAGPRADDHESLYKYAKLITQSQYLNLHDLITRVTEREIRVLAAYMTMEEIFKGSREFNKEVTGKVQVELNRFGMVIYNANLRQLVDVGGYKYISNLGRKLQQEAVAKSEIGAMRRAHCTKCSQDHC